MKAKSLNEFEGFLNAQWQEMPSSTPWWLTNDLNKIEEEIDVVGRECESIRKRLAVVNRRIDRKHVSTSNSLASKVVSSTTTSPNDSRVDLRSLFKKTNDLPVNHVRHLYAPTPWSEKMKAAAKEYRKVHGSTAIVPGLGLYEQVDPKAVIACGDVRNWICAHLSGRCLESLRVYGEATDVEFSVKGFNPAYGFDTLVARFRSNVATIETLLFLKDTEVKLAKVGYSESRHFITKKDFETEILRLYNFIPK